MGQDSKIEWTHHTFNPWRGCTKVSDGCKHCYADTLSKRNPKALGIWGPNGQRVVAAESYWRLPLKWDKEAAEAGERRRVFCASLADVFEDWNGSMHRGVDEDGESSVLWHRADIGICNAGQTTLHMECGERHATMADVRVRLFDLLLRTPHLDWLLLTKRPENVRKMIEEALILSQGGDPKDADYFNKHDGDFPKGDLASWLNDWCGDEPPRNVWLGTSVENQETAYERVPHLLRCPAAVRFLSCEPLLGPIDFNALSEQSENLNALTGLREDPFGDVVTRRNGTRVDWVIVGGESGPGARAMHPVWARSIRDQCQSAGVAFHFKQWGEFAPPDAGGMFSVGDKQNHTIDEIGRLDAPKGGGQLTSLRRVGKKAAGRLLDGRTWDEFPARAAEVARV